MNTKVKEDEVVGRSKKCFSPFLDNAMVKEVRKSWHDLYTEMLLGLFPSFLFFPAFPNFFLKISSWRLKKKKIGKQVFYFWPKWNMRDKIHTTVWSNLKKCKNTWNNNLQDTEHQATKSSETERKETYKVNTTVVLADSIERAIRWLPGHRWSGGGSSKAWHIPWAKQVELARDTKVARVHKTELWREERYMRENSGSA